MVLPVRLRRRPALPPRTSTTNECRRRRTRHFSATPRGADIFGRPSRASATQPWLLLWLGDQAGRRQLKRKPLSRKSSALALAGVPEQRRCLTAVARWLTERQVCSTAGAPEGGWGQPLLHRLVA